MCVSVSSIKLIDSPLVYALSSLYTNHTVSNDASLDAVAADRGIL
jgi:hypothetical protein